MKYERKSFNGIDVRYYWDDERAEWRFSARDVIGALSLSAEPDVYWEIFIKRKDRRIAALVDELGKAVLEDERETEVASAEKLMQLAAFFPLSRRRELGAFLNKICTGFADSFTPLVVLADGMLAADPSVDPSERTIWLTAEDIAVLFSAEADDIRSAAEDILASGELPREECEHRVIMAERYEAVFYSLRLAAAVSLRLETPPAIAFRRSVTALLEEYIIRGLVSDRERLEALGCSLDIRSTLPQAVNGGDADAAYAFILRGYKLAEERAGRSRFHSGSYRISAEECAELVHYLDGALSEADMACLDKILDLVFETDDEGAERYDSAEKKAAAFLWYLVNEAFIFTDELFIFFLYANGIISTDSVLFDGIAIPLLKASAADAAEGSRDAVLETVSRFISLLSA